MRRWLGWAARLYPKSWRERYGVEFAALLDGVEPGWRDLLDVLRGAGMMQLRTFSTYGKLVCAVTVMGGLAAVAASFLMPGSYLSSAVVRTGKADDPQTFDQLSDAWYDACARRSLSELIQRPNLDLYKSERQREPLEDVIDEMKKDLRLEPLNDGDTAAFRVSFFYPDRYKAQVVVDALTQKLLRADPANWMAGPASLPAAPRKPVRLEFLVWGLGVGLLAGLLTSFLHWRAAWTMKVVGFGLAGCALVTALSLLLPDRYTSHATLRVIPAPKADGTRRYMRESELAGWLRKKEEDLLSDSSLAGIIQRSTLDLYRGQRGDGSLQTAIATMRRNLKIELSPSRSAVTIAFTYPDRFKTQLVVSALTTKFTDSEVVPAEADLMAYHPVSRAPVDCLGKKGDEYVDCITANVRHAFPAAEALQRRKTIESIEIVNPASLPERAVAPDRLVLAGAGLFVGLFLGAYTLRKRPGLRWRPA